jgi:translation initiation factor 2B subunit (eIF-2B alpha/beta/delta family)
MTSAIYTSILRALNEIKDVYPNALTNYHFDKIINEEQAILERVATAFTEHVCSQYPETLSIVTLSLSSTIEAALQTLFQSPHCPRVTLTILESRPLFEGVHLARSLLPGKPVDATIEIAVDAAGAYFASTADIVLIGSDHINPLNGDVKNKIGSVAVARAAKRTLVISSTDKLGDVEMEEEVEENAPHEVQTVWTSEGDELNGVKVRNLYFEWVSGEDVDGYVTERGILGREELKEELEEKQKWEEVWEALDSPE